MAITQECCEQYWTSPGGKTPTRYQLYGHQPPIAKTIQVRRTKHAERCCRSRDELISDVFRWAPTYGRARTGRPARTYSSYVRIRDVSLKTCQRRWTIGRSGERWSGISVLASRHDDDDDIYIYIYLIEHYRYFVYMFFVNPFELPYQFFDIRWKFHD